MPQEEDKRLAAGSVAIIAQECDSQTFLRSWSAWGALLTSMVQTDRPTMIRAAAWAAMSCVIARRGCTAGILQSCACSFALQDDAERLHVGKICIVHIVQAGCGS